MTREIPLSRGLVALVDDADFDYLIALGPWHVKEGKRIFYANRNTRRADGHRTTQTMHQLLMGASGIDHANGDGLDNRRANLRPATNSENSRNRRRRTDNTSGYKGVSLHKRIGRWQAYICADGRQTSLGYFDDPTEAALAYDRAAVQTFGEFARLNFPREDQPA